MIPGLIPFVFSLSMMKVCTPSALALFGQKRFCSVQCWDAQDTADVNGAAGRCKLPSHTADQAT